MSDQPNVTPAPGEPAPAAGTPPAAAAPATPPATPPTPATATGGPPRLAKPPKGGGAPPANKAFEQLRKENLDLKRKLSKLESAAAPAPAPAAPQPGAPAPAPRSDRDERVRRENEELRARVAKQKERIKAIKLKERDKRTHLSLQGDAALAGVAEVHVSFALHLYGEAVRSALRAKKDPPTDARAFFASLRKDRPYLFSEPTPQVALSPTTAAPESPVTPGQAPAPANTAPAKKDAMSMSDEEWRAHRRANGITY